MMIPTFSVAIIRRIFRSLVELEDICKSDSKQAKMRSGPNEEMANDLLKSIVLGDIPILQNLLGWCIIHSWYTMHCFVVHSLC